MQPNNRSAALGVGGQGRTDTDSQPLYLVDAFINGPFSGNPAGVCVLSAEQPVAWMQAVAAELNQSETAFLLQREDQHWDLRWFTPTTEVNLCGHATLAAAHVLWHHLGVACTTLEFHTRSGRLCATQTGEQIQLDFPADPPAAVSSVPEALIALLGRQPHWLGQGREDLVAVLDNADQVRRFQPDAAVIASFTQRGLIVTAPGDTPDVDLVSRFFAPNAGIPEDPVTGAVHCLLAVYWAERLHKTRLQAVQASARSGRLLLELVGERVYLSGKARTTLIGDFYG